MSDHLVNDQRGLAFDRLVAAKLRDDPALVEVARRNLERWLGTASPGARRTLEEWRVLLEGPLPELLVLLESADERATRLRQASPFCGMISREERLRVLKEFQRHDAGPT